MTDKQKVVKHLSMVKKATIKATAEKCSIVEPSVRRILGVGAREGIFRRVDRGVYALEHKGKTVAIIENQDSMKALPRLSASGFKADMIFLDIPYKTKAVIGRGKTSSFTSLKYETITPHEFDIMLTHVSSILRTDTSPLFYMYSNASSGLKDMAQYNHVLMNKFKLINSGTYVKLHADGLTRVKNMRGELCAPEGILLLTKSGRFTGEQFDLNFSCVRPKGYNTQKPADLLRTLIEKFTKPQEVVLDPFAGSGVTLVESVKLNRFAYGIEKSWDTIKNFIIPNLATCFY